MSFTDPNILDTEPDPVGEMLVDTGAPEDADAGLNTDIDIDSTPEGNTSTITEGERRDSIIDRSTGA